jgi:cell division GTPase FtsZ
MTSNSCVQDQATSALPADIQLAVTRAWIGAHPDPAISTNRFRRTLMKAMAPEAMLYLDLEEVRDLFKNGDLALGYGRAPLGNGALVKACQASLRCESLMEQSSSEGTSGILVVINAPRSAAVKLSEVRDGLCVIWQWASKASNHLYSTIHDDEIAGEAIEVYLFAVKSDSIKV